jgi:hypothetical protein
MSTENHRLVLANPDTGSEVTQDVEGDLQPVPTLVSENDSIGEDDVPAVQRPRDRHDFNSSNPRRRNSLVARIIRPLRDVKPRPKSGIGTQSLSTIEERLNAELSKPKGRFKCDIFLPVLTNFALTRDLLRVVLVGDRAAKTAQLLTTFTYGFKPEIYVPRVFEDYSMSVR